jgi:amino acid transporter
MTVSVAQVAGSTSPLLDQRIRELLSSGWQIVFRTPTEAQLKKPKQWDSSNVILFTISFTFFFAFGGIAGAFFIAILAFVGYALRGEKTVYYTEEQLRKEQEHMRTKKLTFFR